MENNTVKIAAAGNAVVPAILVLESRSYNISTSADGYWHAEKDGCIFTAESPLELLGLTEMYVARGSNWKAIDIDIDRCMKQYTGLAG